MASDLLNMIDEFSANIRPDLVESLNNAVIASASAGEFGRNPSIISSFSQLITLLSSRRIPDAEAINLYMSDPNTRDSVSRPFFYHMTFRGFLYPEDNPIYPPAPPALPPLAAEPAISLAPPQIVLPADFFSSQPRIPHEDEARAPGIVPQDYDDNNNLPVPNGDGEEGDNNVDEDADDNLANDPMDFEEY